MFLILCNRYVEHGPFGSAFIFGQHNNDDDGFFSPVRCSLCPLCVSRRYATVFRLKCSIFSASVSVWAVYAFETDVISLVSFFLLLLFMFVFPWYGGHWNGNHFLMTIITVTHEYNFNVRIRIPCSLRALVCSSFSLSQNVSRLFGRWCMFNAHSVHFYFTPFDL